MTTDQVIHEIREQLPGIDRAIRNHTPETVSVYDEGLSAFMEGQNGADPEEAANLLATVGLTLQEFYSVRLYLLTMAFMAAWYHVHGNKSKRDQAAHSSSNLVAGTGISAEDAFLKFLSYERTWRGMLVARGIGRRSRLGYTLMLLSLAVVLYLGWRLLK